SIVPDANLMFTGGGANRNLAVIPAANASGITTITVTVTDSDNASARTQFVVTVRPVNDPPTLGVIADQVLSANAPAKDLTLAGIGPGAPDEAQTVTINAVSSNPSLGPNPTVTYTSPNPTAVLTLRPTPNSTGIAVITITADDGQPNNHQTTRRFLVTISGTNQAPVLGSFSPQ